MHRVHELPDPSICRTRHVCSEYWQCLNNDPGYCRFRLRLGSECFCKHEQNYDFSEVYKYDVKL